MPNHCKNVLFFEGEPEDIRQLRRETGKPGRDGESDYVLDFNELIPMPPELDIVSGSATSYSFAAYCLEQGRTPPDEYKVCAKHLRDLYEREAPAEARPGLPQWIRDRDAEGAHEIDLKLGEQVSRNIERFGAPTWYDWRVRHWGTKWNCYECEDEGDRRIAFLTAWAPPDPVFDALARRYPKVAFSCYSVDEGDPELVWSRNYAAGRLVAQHTIRDPELVERIWEASGRAYECREREASRERAVEPPERTR